MNCTIRPMTAKDKPAVVAMMRDFYASPAVWSNGSEEIFMKDIENCIKGSPYVEGYIIADGAEIQGYAMIARSYSTEFGKPCIWIEDLYIREACRGKGAGKAFMTFITQKYTDCIFRLEVEEENTSALALYRKCGFDVLPYMEMKK